MKIILYKNLLVYNKVYILSNKISIFLIWYEKYRKDNIQVYKIQFLVIILGKYNEPE